MSDQFSKVIGDVVHADTDLLEKRYREIAEIATKKLKDAFEEMADMTVTEYMPFVATDLYSNLFSQYGEWLTRDYTRVGAEFGKYTAKDLRQKIYQENREAIIKDLDQDNLDNIAKLEEELQRERELNRINF